MGFRGGNKYRRGNRNRSTSKRKPKPSKTYSLYGNKRDNQASNKRKTKGDEGEETKKPKLEQTPQPALEESSSESEEECANHLTQLCDTFGKGSNDKKLRAVESSEDSSDNSENEESGSDNIKEQEEIAEEKNEGEELVEEDEIDIDIEIENDNIKDPFAQHLFYDLSDSLLNSVQLSPIVADAYDETWPELGKLILKIPKCDESPQTKKNVTSISEEHPEAPKGTIPSRINPLRGANLNDLYIKSQIKDNIEAANKSLKDFKNHKLKLPFTTLQAEMFSVLNNYQDLCYTHQTHDNAEQIRFIYCLHIVNHILKTRTKILHHNAKLSQKDDIPEEFRDHGLVRPKILVILPFKKSALEVIETIINILIVEDKGNVINKLRFLEDYSGNEINMPKKNPKPEDYERLFSGNINDEFKMGITITKKSVKLYADFYSADIIIASPLGLRTIIGAEGEAERDYDFLASIELLILDQTEIFLMQNWDHIMHVFKHIHMQPKESHGTDFARVRTWCLNGWAKYYRQTLIISSFNTPEINSIFNKYCFNYSGKVRTANPVIYGTIRQVFVQLPHVFHKFDASSVAASIDERFNFFIDKILPQQQDSLMKQTMIFVSNYFDYVRLRNYFKREDINFVQICEYSKQTKVARARDMFFHGDAHFLLYTERYHFFNRIRVKGIRHLIFYQLPIFPHFYYELCNLMQEGYMNKKIGSNSNMTVNVVHSKYDVQQLAYIVGTERAVKMSQSGRTVHMLVTDAD